MHYQLMKTRGSLSGNDSDAYPLLEELIFVQSYGNQKKAR